MQQQTNSEVRWEWIGQGWELFIKQWQNWVVMALVAAVVFIVISIPFYAFIFGAEFAASRSRDANGISALAGGASILVRLVFQVIFSVVSALLSAGFYQAAFKQLRGEQVSVSDIAGTFQYLGPILGAAIIIGILQGIGTILCLIPGFIVAGLFMFTFPLIVERNLGMFDAMSASIEVAKKNLVMFTLFAIVVQFLIPMAGVFACCVGMLVAYPLIFLINACAYRDCFGLDGTMSNNTYTPPPPPNYGGYEPPPPPPSSWQ